MHIFVNVIHVTFLPRLFVPLTRLTLQWKPWPRPHTKGCSVGLFTALIKLWTEPSAKELPLLASWTSLALRYSRCGFLRIGAQLSLLLKLLKQIFVSVLHQIRGHMIPGFLKMQAMQGPENNDGMLFGTSFYLHTGYHRFSRFYTTD